MAEVNAFVTPDALLRPEAQTAADRAPERLAEQQRAAENALGGFDEWLGAADVGGNMFESEFEERIVDRVPFVMRNRIRGRIFDVLGAAGLDHQNSLGGSEFSALEQHTWALTRNTTLDAIRNRGRGANTSLLAAEGFGNLLSTSLGGFESEWQTQKQLAQDAFAQFTWWDKVSTLGRKKRFEKFSKKFEEKLKQEKERINVSIKTITQRKKMDVHRAENRVKLVFSRATETEQEGIWRRIRAAIQNPAANVAASLADFTPPAMAQPDFLHALTNLEYADGVVRSRRSAELNLDANRKLEDLSVRDQMYEDAAPFDYAGLRRILIARAVSPAEGESLKIEKIVEVLEKEIASIPQINMVEDVYGGMSLNNIVPAEKICHFVQYLMTNPREIHHIDPKVQAQLLSFLNHLRKETGSNFNGEKRDMFETLDTSLGIVVRQAADVYRDTATGLSRLTNIGATNLGPPPTPQLTHPEFAGIVSRAENWMAECDRLMHIFEAEKGTLPNDDVRRQMQAQWDRVKQFRDQAAELLPKWKQEREAFRKWIDGETRVDARRRELDARIRGLTTTRNQARRTYKDRMAKATGAGRDEATLAAERRLSQAEQNLQQKITDRDNLSNVAEAPSLYTDPRKIEGLVNQLATDHGGWTADTRRWHPTLAALPRRAPLAPNESQGIHDYLRKEFHKEIEKDYLSFLEKNTTEQFDILRKIPTGARIKLTFRDSTNVSTLQVPQDLEQNRTEVGAGAARLRVIRNTAEGVMLESSTHIYVISGPSAKDGKANSNLGVYRKTRVNAAGNPVNSNGLGVPPNAGPDFNIAHSNPNTTGIILSMRIQ